MSPAEQLLAAERRARAALSAPIRDASRQLEDAVRRDSRIAAAVLLLARQTEPRLRAQLAAALVALYAGAWRAGATLAAVEVARLGGRPAPGHAGVDHSTSATGFAASLSASWLLAVVAGVRAEERSPERVSLPRRLQALPQALAARVDTIAVTETAATFAEAHLDAALAANIPPVPGLVVARRWDAELDSATCERCRRMDGRVIPIGQRWHPEPGRVHPRCRCIARVVRVPASQLRGLQKIRVAA